MLLLGATRYQLRLLFHAGSVTAPVSAFTPYGTCESAIKAASVGATSAANASANFARSRKRKPFYGGKQRPPLAARHVNSVIIDTISKRHSQNLVPFMEL
jgi:hypothetical protein